MSRNGSGTYTLPAGNPVVTGTTISSTWANNTLNDIAATLTDSVAADGQTPMTGDLDLNGNQIKNLADGTLPDDAATVGQLPSAALFLLKASNLSDVANATTARGNLTAAKSGANSDITSLTGLTTPLTVAQGGTGAATLTANNVLLGNGTSAPQFVAPSTNGNVLTSNGTTWVSSTPATVNTAQLAKAWVNFNGTTASPSTIRSSFNVTSVTKNGTGDYTINFTNALADANYVGVFGCDDNGNTTTMNYRNGGTKTTTAFQVSTVAAIANLTDNPTCMVAVFG
jgi:hypothetical protein